MGILLISTNTFIHTRNVWQNVTFAMKRSKAYHHSFEKWWLATNLNTLWKKERKKTKKIRTLNKLSCSCQNGGGHFTSKHSFRLCRQTAAHTESHLAQLMNLRFQCRNKTTKNQNPKSSTIIMLSFCPARSTCSCTTQTLSHSLNWTLDRTLYRASSWPPVL